MSVPAPSAVVTHRGDCLSPDAEVQRQIVVALSTGEVSTEGLLPWGSNYVFLTTVQADGFSCQAVYKPQRGERPLWDFPQGTLCLREVAAYVVSEALGWALVPPTVLREGSHGLGSFQWFVPCDPEAHFYTLRESFPCTFRRLALFDILINNADRKAGHCLLGLDGHGWAIDHGVCFHTEPKLRTVIWDYAGEEIPPELRDDIRRFDDRLRRSGELTRSLGRLLSEPEIDALRRRTEHLLTLRHFPPPGPGRPYPWPLV